MDNAPIPATNQSGAPLGLMNATLGDPIGELPAAERLLLDIIDTVREPLLVVNEELRVTHANRAFYRTFKADADTTIQKPLFTIGEGQWAIASLRELLRERLVVEPRVNDVEVDHIFPRVGRKILHINARLVVQGPLLPRLILLAIEDVTDRRLTEWQLAEQRVELQRSNAALEEFASVASHDLQEPLRKIISFGDLLRDTAGPLLHGAPAEHLARMRAAAARMRALINDLLLYSQVSTRPQTFLPTNLAVVAREVVGDLETSIAEAGGLVEIGDLPVIAADALQLRRLFQNLIGNAIKYRRPDVPPVVRLDYTRKSDGSCVISIADNGIGFHEQYAEKIFGMFERLHNRTQYDGSGIGLAVSRKIVERHGGTIAARSTVGQGATFLVTLPVTHSTHGPHS
jgi:signal transduction histidine kinase